MTPQCVRMRNDPLQKKKGLPIGDRQYSTVVLQAAFKSQQCEPSFYLDQSIGDRQYSTKTLFQLPPTTILYMPCDVMMSIATTLRYYVEGQVNLCCCVTVLCLSTQFFP